MRLFFGRISKGNEPRQIEEGYYAAFSSDNWFGDIEINDYAFVIGGDKIQLWKAKAWSKLDRDGREFDRLDFDIIFSDLPLEIKDFVAFKYFKISSELVTKTSRSTGSEKKAFFPIEFDSVFTENILLYKDTYTD